MLTITSQDEAMGSVRISQEATCTNNTATFEAIPNTDYRFKQWNDGNTDNPRTVTLDDDLSFVAEFESTPTSIDCFPEPLPNQLPQKFLREGRLYIQRGQSVYTSTGVQLR